MGLRENILKDPVSEIALRELIAVARKTPVREVAAKMREKRLGVAIVVDRAGKPVGKFTERKLMKLLLEDPKGLDQPVEKFMYDSATPLGRDEPIASLIELMQKQKVRFVCVTDEKGKAVAITGQKGLMEYIAEQFPRAVKAQSTKPRIFTQEREGA
ncbi:MAG: CBS domain-containing protein [Planctomycetota bacterium]|nr:CBS domain-containing protein [Planctomycetota bacterium]